MPRLPSSLKWLIDRRARVAGEIEKIEASLAKCQRLAEELRPLKELLNSIDQTFSLHDLAIDITLIRTIKSKDVRINLPHGELTRAILSCLKAGDGIPVSTDKITAFVAARHAELEGDINPLSDLRVSVRYRLKNLCRKGVVERHHDPKRRLTGMWTLAGCRQ